MSVLQEEERKSRLHHKKKLPKNEGEGKEPCTALTNKPASKQAAEAQVNNNNNKVI